MKSRILIFDSEYSGHHLEYIHHIFRAVCTTDIDLDFIFVVHENVALRLRLEAVNNNVKIVSIAEQFGLREPTGMDGILRAKLEVNCMNHYVEEHAATRCFLLNINPFLLAFAWPVGNMKPCNIEFSGIHFHPFYRAEVASLKGKVKKIVKDFVLRRVVKNKNIRILYILNDHFVVDKLSVKYNSDKIQVLPDPIKVVNFPIQIAKITARKKLLFFGYINERKGIFNFLESIHHIDERLHKFMEIQICGKIDPVIETRVIEEVENLKSLYPTLIIEMNNAFIADEDVLELFKESHLILAPYIKIQGSSGLVGWAAAVGKPILVPDKGLLAELIENYKIGFTVNTKDVYSITMGLENFLKEKFHINEELRLEFLKNNSPDLFVQKILNSF